MVSIFPLNFSATNYNSFPHNNNIYNQTNYNNKLKKITNTQISTSNEKSHGNSSMISTKVNSSESFLFKSIYINKNIKLFKKKNISFKNKYCSSSTNNLNHNIFKKFLKKKFSENFQKLKVKDKLPIMKNIHSFSHDIHNIKQKTEKDKEIQKISFFDKMFRDELFDEQNLYNNHRNLLRFQESTKNRILIRNYLYHREKKYKNDLKENNRFKDNINQNYKKIKYIYNDVINNKINRLIDYNSFLQNKIKILKDEDFEYYKQVELLKKQIKDYFIQIKIKSDRLWQLFDIRNFLICVKEGISLKNLPLIFRCYSSEYLDELTKLNEMDTYSLEEMNKKKNNLNIFHLPTNLLLYIRSLNGFDNENIDSKFQKYLEPNNKIFETPDDFINIYRLNEKKILDHLRSFFQESSINESKKRILIKKIKEIETDHKISQKDLGIVEKYFYEVKTNNNNISNRKLKLSLSTENIKIRKIKIEEYSKYKDSNIRKYIEAKKDENFLKLIRRNNDAEKNQFLYKFHQLKKFKKFETNKEYVYYYIVNNNLKFLSKCPEYYYNQEIFNIKLFNESINNIKNCEQFPDFVIRENIIYLLNIYENAINSLLYEYKNNIKQYKKTDTYYQIRKKEINTKKIYLFEKQKLLDFKIKEMKINKYNRKFTKYRFIPRNISIASSLMNIHSKGKSFEIKNNKGKNDEKDESLLKY